MSHDGVGTTYPGIHFALVTANELVDMVHHDLLQLGFVPNTADPIGQLRMPDGSVSTNELVVGSGPVDKVVGGA